jgi:ribosomal protein L12E/L44/L45/RPP1/RPP2
LALSPVAYRQAGGGDAPADPEAAKARLQELTAQARDAVAESVAAGLVATTTAGAANKRPAGAGAAAEGGKAAGEPAAKKAKKGGMFDAVLGDISSDEDSEDEG